MNSFRASLMIPLFGLLAGLAACSGQATGESTGTTPNAIVTPSAGDVAQAPKFEGRGHGPAGLLFAALHAPIDLKPEQRTTIEAAIADLKPKGEKPDFAAQKAKLAAAVRAGKIDVEALKPPMPSEADRAAHTAALAKALGTLHDTLTKEQRQALVDAISKRGDKQGDEQAHEKKGFEHEQGAIDETHPAFGGSAMRFGGPMHLLKDLNLTQAQQDAIKSKLDAQKPTEADREAMKAKHQAMKKEMDARLQTFVSDTFDAKAFVAPPEGAQQKMGHGPDRMLKDLAIVVPVLDATQREALAKKIEQGDLKGPHAKAGKHHGRHHGKKDVAKDAKKN